MLGEWYGATIYVEEQNGGASAKGKKQASRTEEFRSLSLVSVVYKAMCLIVQERLVKVVEARQLLAEEQGSLGRGVISPKYCSHCI